VIIPGTESGEYKDWKKKKVGELLTIEMDLEASQPIAFNGLQLGITRLSRLIVFSKYGLGEEEFRVEKILAAISEGVPLNDLETLRFSEIISSSEQNSMR
jgi:hypothetical protein